jgi:hypothetical protein
MIGKNARLASSSAMCTRLCVRGVSQRVVPCA